MDNVHEAITNHSKKQHQLVKTFIDLEGKREAFIEEAVHLCKQNKPYMVERINVITKEMNELAQNGIVPVRKYVTEEMVREYALRF